ncbi:MAG: subclass B3 metallo-beta-lactamase [Anaerolineae bacterium]|nr:subclass B3 metallo-beta-lactamase [Gloeobacterales cyanobacterium ES-bin-313]
MALHPAVAKDTTARVNTIRCSSCNDWNRPQVPFRVYGNTYYVGVHGLSAVLIATSKGLILLDGGLPQSIPLIEANIRKLGFQVKDIRLILNSHAHFDHAGGIAGLQRDSGAVVIASTLGAQALRNGQLGQEDPQYNPSEKSGFPKVPQVRGVQDGEKVNLGDVSVTAYLTPGHTPGSTTWAWQSCEKKRCLSIVYADSLNPVSAEGFRFTGGSRHPDISSQFQQSIDRVSNLPCDILLSVHPDFSDVFEKLERRQKGSAVNPFIDPQGCRTYASTANRRLQERLSLEQVKTGK